MPPVGFAINSYKSRSLPISAQRCINYFAEQHPPDAKAQVAMFNAPGIKAFGTGGLVGAVRGMAVMSGVLYAVAGNTLYSVNRDGLATSLGTIDSHGGGVGMAANRANPQELIIVDGASGWTYDTTNGLLQITDGDFLSGDTVAFHDGYFALNEPGTSRWYISDLDDGRSYIATDFADSEASPDEVVAVASTNSEIWVFNETTTEVYYNSGAADFPFARISGAVLERGCAAKFAVAQDDNTIYWLGDDRVFYRARDLAPQRISTHAIEEEIETFANVSDAYAFAFTIAGHKFIALTFPSGRKTYVFDSTTGLWHERESFGQRHWRANSYVYVYGKHIVGDAFEGRLGELDMDTFAEYGSTMQGILTGPVLHGDRKRGFHRRFELDIESGVGLGSGSTPENPQIWMDYSDDGGRTFSSRKPWRSMGRIGEYRQRLRWLRLGQSRQRIYRVSVADAVKRTVIAAHADIALGAN